MKKRIGLLLLCLCLSGTAAAEMENTVPAVGDTIDGFTVTKEEPSDTYGGTFVTLTHEKSGGTVVWLANDDTERSFVIGFRTHNGTDTGVPHVFEHAACSGSEKYQDSGMAFSMMNQLYQTYVNAATNTDWTCYIVASLSDKQLLTMADFMLAGSFHPLVLTDKHAMMREAYRYELPDADSDITLTGTVYSEMQGAYYISAQDYILQKQLYPGSWHSFCAGGKPGVIEEMTQQDLIDFHSTYYVPGNALSMLYGDLNLSDYLALIGSYYDEFTPAEVSAADPDYAPFTGYSRVDCDVPASQSESADMTLVYAVPVRGYGRTDIGLLGQFLAAAIDNDSSAFHALMVSRFPSASVSAGLRNDSDSAEPMFTFTMQNANGVVPEDFVSAVKEGLAADLAEGLRADVLAASLKNAKKELLTARESSHVGVNLSEYSILSGYAMYGDPSAWLTDLNALLDGGEAWLGSGVLESAVQALADPADSRLVVLTKKPGMLEEINAESAKKLAGMKAAMTPEEIQALVDSTAEFKAWQDAQDSFSQIDEVKVLSVAELPEDVKVYTAEDETKDGVRIVTSDTGDSRLAAFTLYFDASGIPAEDLTRYAAIADQLLGTLKTSRHTHDEVSLMMEQYGITFAADDLTSSSDPDVYRPVFTVTVSCLREDIPDAVSAAWEILTDTQFEENDLIRHTAASRANEVRYGFGTQAPYALLYYYSNAALTASGRYEFEVKYTPYYRYLESVGKMDDAALAAEESAWQRILSSLPGKTNLSVSVVSGQEAISEVLAALGSCTGSLSAQEIPAADYSGLTPVGKNMAFAVAGSVNYNMKIIRMSETGVPYTGSLQAVSALMRDRILVPTMRYRNGVYSAICNLDRCTFDILAYRDPSIAMTYDRVLPSLGGQLRGMNLTQDELDSYIINAYSELAMPMGPITGAKTAVSDVLCGNTTFADRTADMASLRSLTPADFKDAAALYDALSEKGVIYTAGSSAAIEAEKDRFESVETWYASSDGE